MLILQLYFFNTQTWISFITQTVVKGSLHCLFLGPSLADRRAYSLKRDRAQSLKTRSGSTLERGQSRITAWIMDTAGVEQCNKGHCCLLDGYYTQISIIMY